jgi:hypothetical protein
MMLPGSVNPPVGMPYVTAMYLRFLRFELLEESWDRWDQIFKRRQEEIVLSAPDTGAKPLLSEGLFQRCDFMI